MFHKLNIPSAYRKPVIPSVTLIRITGMKCGAHAVDLLIKDCAKFSYFADIIKRITKIIQFVKNHHGTSAIYGEKTKLRLITPCATRFATNVMVAHRMLKVSFIPSANIQKIRRRK